MASFCGSCGKELEPGVKFCGSCGAQVTQAPQADAAPVQPAATAGTQPTAAAYTNPAAAGQPAAAAGQPTAAGQPAAAGAQPAAAGAKPAAAGEQSFVDKIMYMAKNTADYTGEMDPTEVEKNKIMACVAYIIFFVPLLACPDSKFGRYHTNQGLLLLLVSIAGGIATTIIRMIFRGFLYWLGSLLSLVITLPILALLVIGLINAYNGKAKDLPFVGTLRLIK